MRYLYAFIGLFLLLAATAVAGSFTVDMDADTYMDANNANQTFGGEEALWVASKDGKPVKVAYLSFINLLRAQNLRRPEQIQSATLTLNAARVEKPGEIKACFVLGPTLNTNTWNDRPVPESSVSVSAEVNGEGSYTLDVAPLIRRALEACAEGCGYSFALVAEDDASVGFTSSEGSEEKRPVLKYSSTD